MGPSRGLHDVERLSTLRSSTILFVYIGRGIHCTILYPMSYIQLYNHFSIFSKLLKHLFQQWWSYIYQHIFTLYIWSSLPLSLFPLFFFFVWCGSCVHISNNLYFSTSQRIQKFTIFKIKTCHLSFHIPFKFKLGLLNIKLIHSQFF